MGSSSADAMEAQGKMQAAMKEMINDLDKTRLRKIQVSGCILYYAVYCRLVWR